MEFVLKGIFDYAVSNGWIGENPVDRVTVPKIVSDDDMVFLSVREVELLAGCLLFKTDASHDM